jgi:hypothetical protein
MGNYGGYNANSYQTWRPQQYARGSTSSFGNQSGLGGNIGGGGYDPTQYYMSGGNDPTSTADINRPTYGSNGSQPTQPTQGAGSGSTASNQNNQPGNGSQATYSSQHPSNAEYVSEDGLVSYDRYGRRLDSNGNVATGSAQQYGSSGGGGGGAAQPGSNYWASYYGQQNPAPNPNSTIPMGSVGPNGTYTPAPSEQQPQQQQPQYSYGLPFDWRGYMGAPEDAQATAQEWAGMQLPYQQFMQNAVQYGMDFQEAQRRWDLEYGRNTGNDQYGREFANRQQTAAEQQAAAAQAQWQAQFGHTSGMDYMNYGLRQGELNLQQEMGRGSLAEQIRAAQAGEALQASAQGINMQQFMRNLEQQGYEFDETMGLSRDKFGLESELGRGNLALANQQALWGYDIDKGNLALGNLRAGNEFTLGQGNLALGNLQAGNQNNQFYANLGQQRELTQAEMQQQNQQYYAGLGSQERMQGNDLGYKYSQLGQEGQQFQQQLEADTQYKYANLQQQAAQVAAEQGLTLQQIQGTQWYQQQQAAIAWGQQQQEAQQFGQSFGLQSWRSQQDVALQQQQLAQQAMLQREQMAAQERQANLAAFGRSAAPNTRWLRQA